jgi:hypothetical protein
MQTILVPLDGAWSQHEPSDGSGIGGCDPVSYGSVLVPGKRASRVLLISGTTDKTETEKPTWLLYPSSPIVIPQDGNNGLLEFELTFDLWVDAFMQDASSAIETDTIFVVDGYKYNGSAQVITATGILEVGAGPASWQSTGIKIPAFTPNIKHKVKIDYMLDLKLFAASVQAYTVDGVEYAVPVANQNVPAIPSMWKPGAYLQLQPWSLPAGNPWSMRVTGTKYRVC